MRGWFCISKHAIYLALLVHKTVHLSLVHFIEMVLHRLLYDVNKVCVIIFYHLSLLLWDIFLLWVFIVRKHYYFINIILINQ